MPVKVKCVMSPWGWIMAWNYPFWQVFRFAAHNLMAGNIRALKQASNVMQSGEMIQEVFNKAGDPMNPDSYIGVLAREDLTADLEKQIKASIRQGAQIVLGGKQKGTFFEPTLLVNVTPDMHVFNEETFGPVIGMTIIKGEAEAVTLVNSSDFGLGVSLCTNDRKRTDRLIPKLNEGAVFVNELVKSDPRLPFGGIKASGYGS